MVKLARVCLIELKKRIFYGQNEQIVQMGWCWKMGRQSMTKLNYIHLF